MPSCVFPGMWNGLICAGACGSRGGAACVSISAIIIKLKAEVARRYENLCVKSFDT